MKSEYALEADHEDIKILKEKWQKKGIKQEYRAVTSSCSCKLADIKGILFGGISSRFWLMRKHLL